MRRALPLLVIAALALLFAAGWMARQRIDVELSFGALDSLRAWVLAFGWQGPAVFVGLVGFRSFLLLPSALLLVLGGIAFGAVTGTLLGALGLALSAGIQFACARVLGDEWVRPRLGERGLALEARLRRAGPWAVALGTAHPAGPMTALHLGAGVTSMPLLAFGLAVLLAAPVRAGAYALIGSSILEWGPAGSLALALLLLGVALLPLLHPRVRAWLLSA